MRLKFPHILNDKLIWVWFWNYTWILIMGKGEETEICQLSWLNLNIHCFSDQEETLFIPSRQPYRWAYAWHTLTHACPYISLLISPHFVFLEGIQAVAGKLRLRVGKREQQKCSFLAWPAASGEGLWEPETISVCSAANCHLRIYLLGAEKSRHKKPSQEFCARNKGDPARNGISLEGRPV